MKQQFQITITVSNNNENSITEESVLDLAYELLSVGTDYYDIEVEDVSEFEPEVYRSITFGENRD